MLRLILEEKKMSLYRLEKISHISHATLNDLYNERTNIDNCSISLLYKLSKALDMSMEQLYAYLSYNDLSLLGFDSNFDLFKSNVLHELKELGDLKFIEKHLSSSSVTNLYKEKYLLEAIYLLSLIDYLSKIYNLPLSKEYETIRHYKLNKLFVSKSSYLLLKSKVTTLTRLFNESLIEFTKHNLLENDIRNVE